MKFNSKHQNKASIYSDNYNPLKHPISDVVIISSKIDGFTDTCNTI